MIRAPLPAAVVLLLSFGCSGPDAYPGQVSTSFDGGKQLVLVADYSAGAQATGVRAWADVDVGTAATVEMTGPLHMHCDGTFQPVPAQFSNPGNRPSLDVGEGHEGAQFHAPPGSYTVVVGIPSRKTSIKKSFISGASAMDPLTGLWELPSGCVPVADTRQELLDLTPKYLQAIVYWIDRMSASTQRSELIGLGAKARDANAAGDTASSLDALSRIRASVRKTGGDTNEYRTYCESNSAIALLTQPAPAN